MQYTHEYLETLPRKKIQSIAKDIGLKCNAKTVDLIAGILESQPVQMDIPEPAPEAVVQDEEYVPQPKSEGENE